MKFETVRIHFLSNVLVCCHSEILLRKTTWRNDFSSLLLTLNISEAPTCDISLWSYHLGFAFFERAVKRMHILKYLSQNDMPSAYQSPLEMSMLGGLRKTS